jgi:hypothetical protein
MADSLENICRQVLTSGLIDDISSQSVEFSMASV